MIIRILAVEKWKHSLCLLIYVWMSLIDFTEVGKFTLKVRCIISWTWTWTSVMYALLFSCFWLWIWLTVPVIPWLPTVMDWTVSWDWKLYNPFSLKDIFVRKFDQGKEIKLCHLGNKVPYFCFKTMYPDKSCRHLILYLSSWSLPRNLWMWLYYSKCPTCLHGEWWNFFSLQIKKTATRKYLGRCNMCPLIFVKDRNTIQGDLRVIEQWEI